LKKEEKNNAYSELDSLRRNSNAMPEIAFGRKRITASRRF